MRFRILKGYQRPDDGFENLCRQPDLYGTTDFREEGLFSQMRYLVIRHNILLDVAWISALDCSFLKIVA